MENSRWIRQETAGPGLAWTTRTRCGAMWDWTLSLVRSLTSRTAMAALTPLVATATDGTGPEVCVFQIRARSRWTWVSAGGASVSVSGRGWGWGWGPAWRLRLARIAWVSACVRLRFYLDFYLRWLINRCKWKTVYFRRLFGCKKSTVTLRAVYNFNTTGFSYVKCVWKILLLANFILTLFSGAIPLRNSHSLWFPFKTNKSFAFY